ncbi:hypothetical protein GGTG_06558 [Gaeumannomyces tritici R3-111a-1]|uniref:Phosphatidate phosphatase APP1 catalytic domain-containing protein n=1 Tax=Gaeumannomyces tritici (strain R3-111a-1) TaxID=644352 RepID=J3NZ58_GAET3|nr:hypothetical protein GGTG_06558 [Gaeumannomyces tritici R3-111a-1]EJT76641.1 hypothetical protein GGTG_06558 [Gaeumannomyces tritici R3-111a-1]
MAAYTGGHPTPRAHCQAITDEMQRKTRQECGFDKAESSLSSIVTSSSKKPAAAAAAAGGGDDARPATAPRRASGVSRFADNLLSYLGTRNPRPRPITRDDTVWLLDNVAFRDPADPTRWRAEFVAVAMDQAPSVSAIDVVQAVARHIGLGEADAGLEIIEQRITPFLQDALPGREVQALHRGRLDLRLGPGGRNGISSDLRHLPDAPAGTVVGTAAQVPQGADGILAMKTLFAEPDGWAVVSDVDDTIKVTQTSDPVGILRSTFLDEPTPVTGTPELYAWLHERLGPGAPFFYLSASPYNLYPFLSAFRDMYFPHGQLVLRDQSWASISGLLSNLTLGTEEYKVSRLAKVHAWLPKRRMILIGDSTQSDPEAYGDIYRDFPGWVRLILIRKVTDIASIGIESKNEPERFDKAFQGVPKEAWHVFEDPAECQKLIEQVVAADP